jgi:hypothetical protein
VEEVAEDYVSFLRHSRLDPDADPRTFGARHAAAKSALAHIEALMKLAGGGDAAGTEQALQLGAARAAIAKEPPLDDDDERDPG